LRKQATLYLVLLLLAVSLAACGSKEKQDANEKAGTWKVQVVSASFPGKQTIADTTNLQLKIKNVDTSTIPDLAVTVDGFDRLEQDKQFAESRRPIWVIESPPNNSTTAFTNTWTVGPVPAGQTRTLKWKVTAVRAGTYTLHWRVAGGLDGKAKVEEAGEPATGEFVVRVSDKARPVDLN
jgi:hypothetical protein